MTKLYYPVVYKKRVGALIVRGENVCFYDDDKLGQKVLELEWLLVTKITANVATSPSPLLKLTLTNTDTTTFKFETRKELNQAKYDMKIHWNACHDSSMRDDDGDEDFTETTRRDDDEDFLLLMNDKSNRSNNTSNKSIKRKSSLTATASTTKINNTTSSKRLSRKQQQSPSSSPKRPNRRRASTGTNYLPRIDSGTSLKADAPKNLLKRGRSEKALLQLKKNAGKKNLTNKRTSTKTNAVGKRTSLSPPTATAPPVVVFPSFTQKSRIQILPHDRILLPRRQLNPPPSDIKQVGFQEDYGKYYRLNFNNFVKSQILEIAIVPNNKSNTVPRKRKMVNLEDVLNHKYDDSYGDVEAQQRRKSMESTNNDDDDENRYRISKRVCKASIMIATCGFCLLVGMTIAVIVLSVLLANAKNDANNNNGGSTGGPLTDDFYSKYFENNL